MLNHNNQEAREDLFNFIDEEMEKEYRQPLDLQSVNNIVNSVDHMQVSKDINPFDSGLRDFNVVTELDVVTSKFATKNGFQAAFELYNKLQSQNNEHLNEA